MTFNVWHCPFWKWEFFSLLKMTKKKLSKLDGNKIFVLEIHIHLLFWKSESPSLLKIKYYYRRRAWLGAQGEPGPEPWHHLARSCWSPGSGSGVPVCLRTDPGDYFNGRFLGPSPQRTGLCKVWVGSTICVWTRAPGDFHVPQTTFWMTLKPRRLLVYFFPLIRFSVF